MSVRVMDAVFRRSASKGSARLVLLALADVASDEGEVAAYKRSHSVLAAKANVDGSTVARAIDNLVVLGELVVTVQGTGRTPSSYRITLPPATAEGTQSAPPAPAGRAPRVRTVRTQAPQDAPPITPSSTGGQPTLPGTPAPAAPTRPNQDPGREVARHVWEHRKPRPSGKFIALSRLFEELLDAGWQPAQVQAAAMASPAFTRDALEFQLNGCGKAQPRGRAGGPFEVDDDRGAPAGVVNL